MVSCFMLLQKSLTSFANRKHRSSSSFVTRLEFALGNLEFSICYFFFFLLNISSIRSVTTKPPTTFSVPSITARKPSVSAR